MKKNFGNFMVYRLNLSTAIINENLRPVDKRKLGRQNRKQKELKTGFGVFYRERVIKEDWSL